jgi:putative DNA primase/helicase
MSTSKPTALAVQLQHIPADLRSIDRWVTWKYVQRSRPDGSKVWAKVPFTVAGRPASTNDPQTWTTFDEACDALIAHEFDGIGIVLGDDLQGIDLDDHRNPETGELSELAKELLEKVEGYAEVSPSGTGIKLFSRTNLDASRTKKDAGVELYKDGRYFTVTGRPVNGHCALPGEVQDLGWFVQKVFAEDLQPLEELTADDDGRALALYRAPLEGWDRERVWLDVLPHLDPDCGYDEWLRVGQALHHQGEGDPEWLDLWDMWSAGSAKYTDGLCASKWASFNRQRARGRGALTLASLLKATKDKRQEQSQVQRRSLLEDYLQQVEDASDEMQLQDQVAARIAHEPDLGDVEREKLVRAIVAKLKTLNAPMPLNAVRGWLRPRVQGQLWAQVNDDGHPLCTLDNLRVLLGRMNYTVRYNVIKKAIEILIPGAGFTRDNQDNAAIAVVYSECEKVRMPTKHVAQYLIAIADENQHNPVATWIESAPWDGVSRLQAFYATVRSAADSEKLKKKLLRKWLIQAVAAAFSPNGIAGQGILTFVGPQNIGKTTWFQRLAPAELDVVLTGHTLDTKSKDSIFVALSFWLVELGEVDATMRKSDISALKSFVTQPMDKIRRPYAATESNFGRRTVFGATVNDEQYLHDPTGNRRFWTVEVEGFDLDHSIDMQQLWAEVLQLWRSGQAWSLDQVEVAELNVHNEAYTAADPIEERLAVGLAWGNPGSWRWATATEALMTVGVKDPVKSQTIAAARVLKRLNGNQRKKSNGRVLFAIPGEDDFLG